MNRLLPHVFVLMACSMLACSSVLPEASRGSPEAGDPGPGSEDPGSQNKEPAAPQFLIYPSALYTGFDGVHEFKTPVEARFFNPLGNTADTMIWTLGDQEIGFIEPLSPFQV